MSSYLTRDLIAHLVVFQSVLLLIALGNTWALRRAARHGAPSRWPKVSVLVPARDEEAHIARCVRSLLAQDYSDFEVLVLDDQSSDETGPILARMASSEGRLRVLSGQPLPPGWLGKNWACHQLAAQASGELLYFTDADTIHQPQALRAAVAVMEEERADLLTGFPRQVVRTWGERLIVPFFSWACYCFLPLSLAYRLRAPALSCAIGQLLVFRRSAYQAIGGHSAIRASIVEDLQLAKRIKAAGHRWRMFDATRLVSCRMYRSGSEARAGLSKNLFAAFEFRLLPYLYAWLWLAVMFLEPPLVLGLGAMGLLPGVRVAPILLCMGLSVALWWVPYRGLRLPWYLALLYPLTLAAIESVAWRSLRLTVSGRLQWKGRDLERPQWKWL